jgi:rod shape-determining protein MreC
MDVRKNVYILFLFIVVIFLWLTYQSLYGKSRLFDFAVYPLKLFQKCSITLVHGVGDFFHNYIFLQGLAEENSQLKTEIVQCKAYENQYYEVEAENRRLRRILELKQKTINVVTVAEVYALSATNWFHTIKIDKGTDSGLAEDMVVITPNGLVGRIHRCGAGWSDVVLVTDLNFSASIRLQSSRVEGILVGSGSNKCYIKYIPLEEKIEEDERVVTSGLDGIFPEGIFIGTVSKVLKRTDSIFQHIEVVPEENLETLEEVIVVER